MTKRKIMEQEVMSRVKGEKLDTITYSEIRVFHTDNPDYTYRFLRQEGSEVFVVDDKNGKPNSSEKLKTFLAKELVNVKVFRQALLDSVTTTLFGKKK